MKSLVLIFALAFATFASAADLTGKIGLGLNASYPVPSFGNNFNDYANPKYGFGAHVRYHFLPSLGLEVSYSRSMFKAEENFRFDNYNAMGLYRFSAANDFTFIGGLGLGATVIQHSLPHNTKLSLLARFGADWNVLSNLTVGAYVDYQYVSKFAGEMRNRAHILAPTLGLTWYFGTDEVKKEIEKREEVQEAKKEVEQKVQEKKEEIKAKLDGDDDHDGILNSEDKCPGTPAGQKVNAYGCAEKEKAEIRINVEFLAGKADVRPQYKSQIEEVANFLKKYPTVKAQIEGHSDNVGKEASNQKLSQRRATSVMNAIVKLGVKKDRLTAKGFGSSQPIADNSTNEGKQKNRRVMAVIKSE